MKAILFVSIVAASSFAARAVVAEEGGEDHDIAGVWYGTYQLDRVDSAQNAPFGRSRSLPLTLYVFELRAIDDEIVGTMSVGSGVDTRTAREKAMAGLGLPAPDAPAAPEPQVIEGSVDGQTVEFATLGFGRSSRTVEARVNGDRMRAEVRTGRETRVVRLRRCESSSDAANEDCSIDALWERYLEESTRARPTPPMPGLSELPRVDSYPHRSILGQ